MSVSASYLSNTSKLSFLAIPLGPDCHFGASAPIEELLKSVQNVSLYDVQRIEPKLQGNFAYSYHVPRESMQDYCRVNLVEFLDIVNAEVRLKDKETCVFAKSDTDAQQYFQPYLTKESSEVEYCLVYKKGDMRTALVATEAKAVVHSSFQAVSQGVALAAEFVWINKFAKGSLIGMKQWLSLFWHLEMPFSLVPFMYPLPQLKARLPYWALWPTDEQTSAGAP